MIKSTHWLAHTLNLVLFLTQLLLVLALRLMADGINGYLKHLGKPIPRLAEYMFQSGSSPYVIFALLLTGFFLLTTILAIKTSSNNYYVSGSLSLVFTLLSFFIFALSLLFWATGGKYAF